MWIFNFKFNQYSKFSFFASPIVYWKEIEIKIDNLDEKK